MPRKAPSLTFRVDHHHFHGYVVQIKRRGRRYERYFHDQGDAPAALARAKRFRDRLLATLPPPRRFHSRGPTRTGLIGVTLRDERPRRGARSRSYRASWRDEKGKQRSRSFSIRKYGRAQAFALACDTRARMLEQRLRPARPRSTPLIPPRPQPKRNRAPQQRRRADR